MKRCSKKAKLENILRRVPMDLVLLVKVAVKNNSSVVDDLDKIIKTHSCRLDRSHELMEHIVALVASEFDGADRCYLRKIAFDGAEIEPGQKHFKTYTLKEVTPEKDGWFVRFGESSGTLLPFAPDGYEPKAGDKISLHELQLSVISMRVVEGHVFSYNTVERVRNGSL